MVFPQTCLHWLDSQVLLSFLGSILGLVIVDAVKLFHLHLPHYLEPFIGGGKEDFIMFGISSCRSPVAVNIIISFNLDYTENAFLVTTYQCQLIVYHWWKMRMSQIFVLGVVFHLIPSAPYFLFWHLAAYIFPLSTSFSHNFYIHLNIRSIPISEYSLVNYLRIKTYHLIFFVIDANKIIDQVQLAWKSKGVTNSRLEKPAWCVEIGFD